MVACFHFVCHCFRAVWGKNSSKVYLDSFLWTTKNRFILNIKIQCKLYWQNLQYIESKITSVHYDFSIFLNKNWTVLFCVCLNVFEFWLFETKFFVCPLSFYENSWKRGCFFGYLIILLIISYFQILLKINEYFQILTPENDRLCWQSNFCSTIFIGRNKHLYSLFQSKQTKKIDFEVNFM